MEALWELAKDLGHELQHDERFIRTQMAQAKADEDGDLQALIGEFNLKRMAINAESEKAEDERDEEKLRQLNIDIREVYAKVMANDAMAEYQAAKAELDKLVNGIGAIINMAAQGLNPDEFEEHNCSGNCSSCGGCH
ncbi:MAG: YlbF family regulator [Clostridia bacterium]|nr:YlbF family regulator [Clostridia bacterium]